MIPGQQPQSVTDVLNLPSGQFSLTYPANLSDRDVEAMESYFKLIIMNLKRRAKQETPEKQE